MSGFHTSFVLKLYYRNNLWSVRFVTSRSCIFHILVLQIIGKPSLRARCPQSGGRREVIATTSPPGTLCICWEPRSSWSWSWYLFICWIRPFWCCLPKPFRRIKTHTQLQVYFLFPWYRGFREKVQLSKSDKGLVRSWWQFFWDNENNIQSFVEILRRWI